MPHMDLEAHPPVEVGRPPAPIDTCRSPIQVALSEGSTLMKGMTEISITWKVQVMIPIELRNFNMVEGS
ncbi:MAG: hypothetical protein ACUVTM_04990 [Candidatus Bathyarchaeia archaeon]